MRPTDSWRGASGQVRSSVREHPAYCQAVELKPPELVEDYRPDKEFPSTGTWVSCGKPPFATVTDISTGLPKSVTLCWAHLLSLGDTGTLMFLIRLREHLIFGWHDVEHAGRRIVAPSKPDRIEVTTTWQ